MFFFSYIKKFYNAEKILTKKIGKIWGGSRLRRLLQAQDSQKSLQKLYRRISTTTDVSPTSSTTDEDEEDDDGTVYEDSSMDEESYSEESNTLCALKPITKAKHQNNHK